MLLQCDFRENNEQNIVKVQLKICNVVPLYKEKMQLLYCCVSSGLTYICLV